MFGNRAKDDTPKNDGSTANEEPAVQKSTEITENNNFNPTIAIDSVPQDPKGTNLSEKKTAASEESKKKFYRRPERSLFSINQSVKEAEEEEDVVDINNDIDNSLPQDDFSVEEFKNFWTTYMAKIKSKDKPLYNVLDTAKWRLTAEKNIELIFDSSVMILEFEKSKEDFIRKVRKQMNNYGISIRTKINKVQKTKNHIKSRREIYEDLVKNNPAVEVLRQKLQLDIDNEPD